MITADWVELFSEIRSTRRFYSVERMRSQAAELPWPEMYPHYSELNPGFVTFAVPRGNRSMLARDGAKLISRFFGSHSAPRGFSGTLYVHESCEKLIPRRWQERCALYRVSSVLGVSGTRVRRALVCGVASERYCSPRRLSKIFKYGGDFSSVSVFLAHEVDPAISRQRTAHLWKLLARIRDRFGCEPGVIDWRSYHEVVDYSGFQLIELNDRSWVADSGIAQNFLRKGARSASIFTGASGERFYPLSPYHGYVVRHLG